MLREWLGIVCKVPRRLSIESGDVLDSKCLEECWKSNATYRVDAVEGDVEVCLADSLDVN